MFFKQSENTVEFFTEVESLLDTPPIPANKFYPSWFKNMPPGHDVPVGKGFPFGLSKQLRLSNVNATIKRCPGVISYLSTGWIIPLWSDFVVQVRQGSIYAFGSNETAYVSMHSRERHFHTMPEIEGYYPEPLKFTNPWKVLTPPGYSVLLCAPFYHLEQRFTVVPGVIDSDTYHHMHVNTFFKNKVGDYNLKMNMPFLQVIPFKRTSIEADIRIATDEDKKRLAKLKFKSDRFFGKNKSMQES